MKFKFSKNLEYQVEAMNAVVDIFDTGKNISREESLFTLQKSPTQVIGNELEIDPKKILKNIKSIQEQNKIEPRTEDLESMDFSVEMETGTGKTYVYLRTILELNQKYGLKKFVILVPSVAIREGVLKTIEQTKEHFREIYNTGFGYFAYDSDKLSQVRDFVQSIDVQIMIMTIQSFNADTRILRQTPDRFHGERPLDLIAETKPVVIMDEPQNMESDLAKEAIEDLKPLFKLRYSATHREIHNLVYRLTPIDAYKMNLVKRIQVYGVKYIDPSELMFKVRSIEIKNRRPVAEVLIEKKKARGKFGYSVILIKAGDDLVQKSSGNEKYNDLFVIDVNKTGDFVELSNGVQYKIQKEENKIDLFRAQISETIKAHFTKQQKLGESIKVLSLFFIDKVDNYVNKGILAQIFNEEFNKSKVNYSYFKDKHPEEVQKGYFASKKVRGQIEFQDTKGDSKADKEAYDLIMKNKEQLLSFKEPVSFIFSHSALKEGWDNPNIFQICTLRETKSEMKKRQEIGRGLRLPLDIEGNRINDQEINKLTVIANESYEEYVASLQTEFDEAGYAGDTPYASNVREKMTVKTTRFLENEEFKILWDKIKQKTTFNIELDTQKIIDQSVKEINELDLDRLAITVDRTEIFFDKNNEIKTGYVSTAVVAIPKKEIKIQNFIFRIASETGLTKKTIFTIFEKINNLALVFSNPEEFIRAVSLKIYHVLNDLLINESIKYIPINESWEVSLFTDFDSYLNRLVKSTRSPFSHIEFDSEGERDFAESLERTLEVKVYTKLPRGFCVDTPIGEYRPDWALVWSEDGKDKLYLVRETKFGIEGVSKEEILKNLRPDEQRKILCGQKHFAVIGADFDLATQKDLSDLK